MNGFIEHRVSGKLFLVVDEDETAAVSSDSEWNLVGSPKGRGNQQQEAAAAGSQELTAQGAGPSCRTTR